MRKRIVLYFICIVFFFFFNFYFRPVSGNSLVTKEYKKSDSYINNLYYSDEYFKKSLLEKDNYFIYDKIIDSARNGTSKVTLDCVSDNCDSYLIKAYNALYLDHPELISFLGLNSYKIENNKITFYNYKHLDPVKSFLGTKRIEREIDIIKKETNKLSEKEKIIYVYDYVASHQYDRLFTYVGSNQSAYSFFTKGSSVCAGFAKASQLIFQNIGIKSYLVLSSSHMWNFVEYEGKYYVFDATVGASYSDKKSNNFYDGLGETTIGDDGWLYLEYYPPIENTKLRDIFNL